MSDLPQGSELPFPSKNDVPANAATQPHRGTWVVENYVYRGANPPQGPWKQEDWVEVPHQHDIPISWSRLSRILAQTPEGVATGKSFTDFLQLFGMLYHVHFYQVLRELKEDYEYFSASTGEMARQGTPEEELLWRERRFLSNFLKAMVRGNFHPFREEEYQQALKHNYLFDLPVELHWEAYDERLFANFDAQTEEQKQQLQTCIGLQQPLASFLQFPASFRNRIWTFYQGLGREQREGVFLPEKIDLILSDVVKWLIWPFQWIVERMRGESPGLPQNSLGALKHAIFGEPSKQDVPEDFPDPGQSHIFERLWFRRLNLRNQSNHPKDLLQVKQMQEPTFRQIISLFRMNPPRPKPWLQRLPLVGHILQRFFPQPPHKDRDWTIYIKLFHEIPMADSEMIFPARKLLMKSSDITVLVMTALAGFYALYRGLQNNRSTLLFVVLGVLGLYVVKLILGYIRVRQKYLAKVTDTLYHKNLNNDMGVLEYLVSAMEEQDLKESVLVYFILWRNKKPMTLPSIDAAVETFLYDTCQGIEVDFEVEDALRKVTNREHDRSLYYLPMVHTFRDNEGNVWYQAIPLEELLPLMDQRWDQLYST